MRLLWALGKDAGKIGLEECELDSELRIVKCPLGKHPLAKTFDGEKGRIWEEALFGRLKQFTPLRRFGVRGKLAVYNGIYSILTVHNIMQMIRFYKNKPLKKTKKPDTASAAASRR